MKLAPLSAHLASRLGNTPLFRLENCDLDPLITLYVKMECYNPSGSIKDRAMEHIFRCEERKSGGFFYKKAIIASRGNGALSFALFARARGVDPVIFSPDDISLKKIALLKKLGATLYLCPHHFSSNDPEHYIQKAKEYAKNNPDQFNIDLQDSYRNPEAYYLSLGPEIWEATKGKIDYLIGSGSTGGSLSGTSRFLKEKKKSIITLMADPEGSSIKSYFEEGRLLEKTKSSDHAENTLYNTEINYIGKSVDFGVIDDVLSISFAQVEEAERILLCQEQLIVGRGSLIALAAAFQTAKQIRKGATFVVLMRDSYL